jgi:VCBS repeat protein
MVMESSSVSKGIFIVLCLLFLTLTAQAQKPPVLAPGQQVTQAAPSFKVISADVNNDGFADLISLESTPTSSEVEIYLSNGDGTFKTPFPVFEATNIADVAIGDFNQDGNLDLAVGVNTGSIFDPASKGSVTVIFGNGQGSFGSGQTYAVQGAVGGIAAGDFNNDGVMDLATVGAMSKSVTILTNAHGVFTANSFSVPTSFDTSNPGFLPDFLTGIVAGDFNADGKIDLFYQDSCGDSGCVVSQEDYFLLTNNGSGFTVSQQAVAGSTGAGPMHVADFDGDGRSDVYFAFNGCHTPCNGVIVLYSKGDGTFQGATVLDLDNPVVAGDPIDVTAGDFNYDGILDIVTAAGFSSQANPGMDILMGKGGRNGFSAPFHIDSPNGPDASPFRIAAGFFNHDATTDILLIENGHFIPFFNQTQISNGACPYTADPGLDFCFPVTNNTSPVRFNGAFHAQTQPANRIELWIDGKKQFQVFGDIINHSMPVSVGTHTATLVGVSATGRFIKSSRTFSVQAGSCPAPVGQSVFICIPTEGSTVASPVHITAAATAPPGRKITAMRIYIDNKAQLTVSAANITDNVPLPAGKHTLVVVAWDNTGASLTGTRHFTIAGSNGPCLPSSAGVKICTPAAGATVSSPVRVAAGAVPTAQRITAIRVYVDNVAVFFASNSATTNSFSINAGIAMAAGTRHMVVVAYQNNGTAITAGETMIVH